MLVSLSKCPLNQNIDLLGCIRTSEINMESDRNRARTQDKEFSVFRTYQQVSDPSHGFHMWHRRSRQRIFNTDPVITTIDPKLPQLFYRIHNGDPRVP